MKIAFLSGRPKNGTLLPREEKLVWREMVRVLREDLEHQVFKNGTFLIPIYNKFDLYALSVAEKNHVPVEYYLPTDRWGTEKLPQHQLYLIQRMQGARHVCGNSTQRMIDMIRDADYVYLLPDTDGVERFLPYLEGKSVRVFPTDRMRYFTEEDGAALYEQLRANTAIHMQMQQVRDNNTSNREQF